MAKAIQVFGLALIKVGASELGYTTNGAQITEDVAVGDVKGDEKGGDEGTPVDIQIFDRFARIRLELYKWDTTVADGLIQTIRGTAAAGGVGIAPAAGTLMFANSRYVELSILNPNGNGTKFVRVVLREPVEINKGTRYSRLVLEGTAYTNDDNKLYEAV